MVTTKGKRDPEGHCWWPFVRREHASERPCQSNASRQPIAGLTSLATHQSIYLSIHPLSLYPYFHLPSTWPPTRPPMYSSIISILPATHNQFIHLSIHLCIHQPKHPSAHPSTCPPTFLHTHPLFYEIHQELERQLSLTCSLLLWLLRSSRGCGFQSMCLSNHH